MPTVFTAVLLTLALVALALVFARDWLGPVFAYEAVRTTRKLRFFIFRVGYAVFLFALLIWIRFIWGEEHRHADLSRPDALAELAYAFFIAYAVVQFLAAVMLTPVVVGNAIAEEKDRRTLEFLLATDLANREIIFGKLAARVGGLILFLIVGLPVLSLIQFFGGIDPAILMFTTAGTLLAMCGLIGISLVNTVQRRKARDAVVASFIYFLAYFAACILLWLAVTAAQFSSQAWVVQAAQWAAPAVEVFGWGGPVYVYQQMQKVAATTAAGDVLKETVLRFGGFHLTVCLAGLTYAVTRLRAVARAQSGGPGKGKRVRVKRRPPVSARHPMRWKEVWVEGSLKPGRVTTFLIALFLIGCFAPAAILLFNYFTYFFGPMNYRHLAEGLNVWARTLNVVFGMLMLLGVVVRAAGSVGNERDKDTLTSLLTTPLTPREIISGKAWGAVASVRPVAYCLMLVWLIGLASGAVAPFALPLGILALVPPLCAAAAWGMFSSVFCRTTLRSVVMGLTGAVFGLGGHWIVSGFCCFLPIGLLMRHTDMQFLVAIQAGFTPPVALGVAPLAYDDLRGFPDRDFPYVVLAGLAHLSWFVIAAALAAAAVNRFAVATNRAKPRYQRTFVEPP